MADLGQVWNLFPEADKIREMLKFKIQEQTLRSYIFSYGGFYDTLSLPTLRFATNPYMHVVNKMEIWFSVESEFFQCHNIEFPQQGV